MQKEPKVLIKTFNDDEVRTLLSVFDYSTFLSARNKVVLAIAFDTGARNTEICEIKREDVHDNMILLHGKGNKERHVPIQPLSVVLNHQLPSTFTNFTGTIINFIVCIHLLKGVRKRCSVVEEECRHHAR